MSQPLGNSLQHAPPREDERTADGDDGGPVDTLLRPPSTSVLRVSGGHGTAWAGRRKLRLQVVASPPADGKNGSWQERDRTKGQRNIRGSLGTRHSWPGLIVLGQGAHLRTNHCLGKCLKAAEEPHMSPPRQAPTPELDFLDLKRDVKLGSKSSSFSICI